MKSSVMRAWKVWSSAYADVKEMNGIYEDFSNENQGVRILDVQPIDGTDKQESGYLIVKITRNTAEECYRELEGQLSDGLFENYGGYAEEELTEAENG